MEVPEYISRAHQAFNSDDVSELQRLLQEHPELRRLVSDSTVGPFDSPPVVNVKSREMLDLLMEYGADINAKSQWWAGGFGLLHTAPREVALYALERGAEVDIHAAARLGLLDRLRKILQENRELVHARGGDGQTPLHFASSREIAELLLDHGSEINARDVDHESTPAQWMLGDRLEVARYLVERGCETDLLMAAALGDIALARKLVRANPGCVRVRVSEQYFPMAGVRKGGTIYQWVLGWHVSPHQVARKRGHEELFAFLMEESPVEVQLINAAWLHDTATVERLLAQYPGLAEKITDSDARQIAHAARNNDTEALRLFLKAGFPVNARGQHDGTALHWVAWHGNREAVRVLLEHGPDLEDAENDFRATPLGWAVHGSENGWHRAEGDYVATVKEFLRAGVKPPDKLSGTPEVLAALRN
jgi:ankyrin repeat protein